MKQVQLPATRVFKKKKLMLKSTVVTPLVRDVFKTMFVKKNHKNVEWLGEAVTANGKSYYESAIQDRELTVSIGNTVIIQRSNRLTWCCTAGALTPSWGRPPTPPRSSS